MAQAAVIDKCDLCESEANVDFFCVDCDEILCLNCKLLHSKSKGTRNHKIKLLSEAKDENIIHKSKPVFCGEHSTVEVTLFCLQCDCLVCTQCLAGEHKGHNITVPDEIKDSKAEKLNEIIKTLHDKKSIYENAFDVQGKAYSRFLKSMDEVEKEIFDHKTKMIEELNIACNEQLSQITKLRQDEETKYSDACNEIQVQNKAVTSAIQMAENSIASNNAVLIIQATTDSTETVQGLQDPTMPTAIIATYQPGDRRCLTIREAQGKVYIKHTTASHQPDDRSCRGTPQVLTEQQGDELRTIHRLAHKRSGDQTQQGHDINKTRIDLNKVKVKSTIGVKGIGSILVVVPLQNKTVWIKAFEDTQLSLLDSKGKIIKTSVTLGNVKDAIEYTDGLLVTCLGQCTVTKMSTDGQTASTFSDLSPYQPTGLCVTQDIDAMVCLQSAESKDKNKVVRLNSEGNIIQTIQRNVTGAHLYTDPVRVTSLTTGEVIVVDWSEPRRITGVDSQGQHLFTWEGEVQGRKLDQYSVNRITSDSSDNVFVTDFHNHRVYVLWKDGSGAMCLLDKKHGLEYPQPVAIDNAGQLWVGCYDKIHIIKY